MKILLFGASGMIGQGVLRECLLDPDVDAVLSIGRSPSGTEHSKLREIQHRDFTDFSTLEGQLSGYDACFFCLGVSSAGMGEADYTRVTYDFALSAGQVLARLNPQMTFIYVSGAGTDSSARGRTMWARVKGETENDLLALPFRAYMFRPAAIEPRHGIQSKTPLYRVLYAGLRVTLPLLRRAMPKYVTSTEDVGRAMLQVAKHGADKRILENSEINALAGDVA